MLQGKAWTSIEPTDTKVNDLCMVRDTGMLFLANEAPKILTYYIPVSLFYCRWNLKEGNLFLRWSKCSWFIN